CSRPALAEPRVRGWSTREVIVCNIWEVLSTRIDPSAPNTSTVKSTSDGYASGSAQLDSSTTIDPFCSRKIADTESRQSTPSPARTPRVPSATTDSTRDPVSHTARSRVCGIRNHAGEDADAHDSIDS